MCHIRSAAELEGQLLDFVEAGLPAHAAPLLVFAPLFNLLAHAFRILRREVQKQEILLFNK